MITVYEEDVNEYGKPVERPVGRFDPAAATRIEGRREWDGHNMTDVHVGHGRSQALYRTASGRYVLETTSRWVGEQDTYRFVTDDEAKEWLIRNENQAEVEAWFGEDWSEERGPGRPEIGGRFQMRLPDDLRRALERVQRDGESLAETARRMMRRGLERELVTYTVEVSDDGGQIWYAETDEATDTVPLDGNTPEQLAREILDNRLDDLQSTGGVTGRIRVAVWQGSEPGHIGSAIAVVEADGTERQ